jgi:hypothetical protein
MSRDGGLDYVAADQEYPPNRGGTSRGSLGDPVNHGIGCLAVLGMWSANTVSSEA